MLPAHMGWRRDEELVPERVLGEGAGGQVLQVRDRATGARYAKKPLPRDRSAHELRWLSRLRHPNVLWLEGIVDGHEGSFLLTRLADSTLADALAAGNDPAALLAGALRALAFLHARGVIHGDLKPANLLVDAGALVVADLDLARRLGAAEAGGTPGFMAPERLAGAPSSVAGDLYGLGAAFAVAAGAPVAADLTRAPDELAKWLGDHPTPLMPLLADLVARDAARRPPSARAAAKRLASLANDPSLARETDASARAYLRPAALVGQRETLERLARELSRPGVVLVRAAAGSGGSRLLEELAIVHQTSVVDPRHEASPFSDPDSPKPVLLDDADLADEPIETALVDLARRSLEGVAARRAAVLVRPHSPLEKRLLAEGARAIDLPPLTESDAVELVEAAYPDRGDARPFARRLHELSGGAPARAFTLLASLASVDEALPGALVDRDVPDPSLFDRLDLADLSATLAAALERTLSPAARALAWLASLSNRPLPTTVARQAFGAMAPEGSFAQAFDELVDLRVLRPGPEVQIDGEQMRQAVGTLDSARADGHAALARAWEAPAQGDSDAAWLARAASARHRVASGQPAGEVESIAEGLFHRSFSREASTLLQEVEALESLPPRARVTLARALAQLGDFQGAVAQARQAEAPLLLAEVLVRQGDYAQAVRDLEEVRAELGADPERDALLARALALSGRHERALEICSDALGRSPSGAAALDLAITRALAQFYRGDLTAARTGYRSAQEQAHAARDLAREANAVNGLGLVAQRLGRFDEAREHYETALALAERCGDRARAGTSRLNLGTVLQELGRTREAAQAYRSSATVARLIGERVQGARARSNLANLLLHVGRATEAQKAAAQAREMAASAGAGVVAAYALLLEGEAALVQGESARAQDVLTLARDEFEAMGSASEAIEASVLIARAKLAEGRHEEAAELSRQVARRAAEQHLGRHEAQALLVFSEASGRGEAALSAAHRTLGIVLLERRPDWLWRAEAMLALASADEEARAHHAARARKGLEAAAASVDEDDRASFLARPDRAKLKALLPSDGAPGLLSRSADSRLARLLSINRRLGAERNLRPLLEGIIDQAVELCGAERGFVLLAPDKEGGPLDVTVARNIDKESLAKGQLKVSHSIAERVVREGEPELTLDAQEDERYQNQLSVAALKLRSVVCVPLRLQGKVLGALYIDNRFRARAFGAEDLTLLEAFADQAAIALGQVRALDEARSARDEATKARAEIESLNAQLSERVVWQQAELDRARREAEEQRLSLSAETTFSEIVGTSPPMRRLLRQMERVAATDLTVLVTGESGTGKELVARAIFAHGPRRDRPFVSVNCAALSEGILESELFGHVRGAFTGADRDRDGLFQVAHTGTLFLDEVGDMGPAMQVKLLRALQEGEIRKVGGKEAVKVDVRVVAATNRDLSLLIAEKRFREDLYYRLNVVSLALPPLRERPEDLPALCAKFLATMPGAQERRYRLSPEALMLLSRHAWPGNVRELQATLRNAVLFAEGELLGASDFAHKPELFRAVDKAPGREPQTIQELEIDAIQRTLTETRGNKAETARRLGIDRKTLYNKLARVGGRKP